MQDFVHQPYYYYCCLSNPRLDPDPVALRKEEQPEPRCSCAVRLFGLCLRIQGSGGFRGFRVQGFRGFRVQGFRGFRVSGFRV